ncbi:short chain dehydrogenase family protein 5 [Achromobacter xylosoxidans A8]|uniref:Short chain dehydrogenase family protein 5 n=1 Tax=Achromobacter xylosoxidans (strain A8) TaxID=762376 RepID=E3HUI3_ACHXA|nr:SDR family oxidoreductase [Achromobacter xylosoxidans]ADP13806.1 short chain dehydrogenase family protein 5 [Achromobacter xylosoxidans A8]
MGKLQGKTAVVTGGNSGIGYAAAEAFIAEGARVAILGRRRQAVDAAVARLGAAAFGVVGDVADLATHAALAAEVRERFGAVDIYMANAGMNNIEPSAAVSVGSYDAQFGTNTRAVFFGVTGVLPLMRDGGSIIVTSSIASAKVLENHAVYAGSKAAVEAFARAWALEFKSRRIRVNVLSPGPTDTPILEKLGVAEAHRPAFEQGMASLIPLGRLAQSSELARAALFLASDDSSFITGVNLRVDGGIALT